MPGVVAPTIPSVWAGGRRHGGPVALPGGLREVETHQGNTNIWSQSNGIQLGEIYTYLRADQTTWDEYWVLYDIADWHDRVHKTYAPAAYLEHVATGIAPWFQIRAALKQLPGASSWKWFKVTYTYDAVPSSIAGTVKGYAAVVKQAGNVVGRMVHLDSTSGGDEHWCFTPGFTTPSTAAAFRFDSLAADELPNWVRDLPGADRYIHITWTAEEAL